MSPDKCLLEEGDYTGLNYSEICDEYLKILLAGIDKRSKHTLELFEEWDKLFFPKTADQGVAARAGFSTNSSSSAAARGANRAMERLDDDEQVPEETDEQ